MHALLLTLTLSASPEPVTLTLQTDSMTEVAQALAPELQTGALLFCKGDCLAVRVFTASPYTHVAAVVMKDGQPQVYDSMNGVGTRRLTLTEWLESQRPSIVYVYAPREPFSDERAQQLESALDQRLGRPYAIRHHLTGQRADGMHCAEYVTDGLIEARLIKAKEPPRVSPNSLREGLLRTDLYEPRQSVALVTPEPPAEKGDGWCSQLWIDTKLCTLKCCRQCRGWFLCR